MFCGCPVFPQSKMFKDFEVSYARLIEMTQSLVPRLTFRDMLGNGADEFRCCGYLGILPATLAHALRFYYCNIPSLKH